MGLLPGVSPYVGVDGPRRVHTRRGPSVPGALGEWSIRTSLRVLTMYEQREVRDVKREVDGWMRCFTWMAVLGPLGPPDIPQATPLPVPGKTSSQCSPRHFHSPRVQGLRRTSQSGACASLC